MDIKKIEKVIVTKLILPDDGAWLDFKEWVESIGVEENFVDELLYREPEAFSEEFHSCKYPPHFYFSEDGWVELDEKVAVEVGPYFPDIESCRFLKFAPASQGGCDVEIKYFWHDLAEDAKLRREEEIAARNARGVVIDGSVLRSVPTDMKKFIVPDGVRNFDQYAFAGCDQLEEVVLPVGIETIGRNVFGGCRSLKKANIPSSVTSIEAYAFSDCPELEPMQMPLHLTQFGHSVFKGCKNYVGRPILSGDGRQLLAYYDAPPEVVVPDGVEEILGPACEHNRQITKVVIPATVKSIHARAFFGCLKISEVELPGDLDISGNFLSHVKSIVRK